ncbi:DNA replication and repair protein RecF [Acrasis kona]|uniref:DNA replication and repair protein RecF n=1 Tax=Acrasis kona TaxID=1008807 RepID=A0AAW2ZBG1_9EUKA
MKSTSTKSRRGFFDSSIEGSDILDFSNKSKKGEASPTETPSNQTSPKITISKDESKKSKTTDITEDWYSWHMSKSDPRTYVKTLTSPTSLHQKVESVKQKTVGIQ